MRVSQLIKKKPYETYTKVYRRHPITFTPILTLFLVLLLVPVILTFVIEGIFPDLLVGARTYPLLVLLASAYTLTMFLLFYVRFLDYYLDMWIVTNDRIVDIEQHNLFSRSVTELDLFRIQDVTVETHGFFATIFKYGDIHVKTASSNSQIIFYQVYRPNTIREKLLDMANDDRRFHLGAEEL